MIRHDKLVRDRIPEIIRANGKNCVVRALSDEEYTQRLDEKLAEEVAEYQESGEVEELADLVELVRAIVTSRSMTWDQFEELRLRKQSDRGGFTQKILLVATVD